MRTLVLLSFAGLTFLAPPVGAASPADHVESCLLPFVHTDKHGKRLFHFQPRAPGPGVTPASVDGDLTDGLVCSPGGRIIDAGELEGENTQGASDILIIDGPLKQFVFAELATGFNLSPDKRFIVFGPWSGPTGTASIVAAESLYLIDVDGSLTPGRTASLQAVSVYPTDTDDFHKPPSGKDMNAALNKWYSWFASIPHVAGPITWIGPRQFQFPLDDGDDGQGRARSNGNGFTATATIVLAAGRPPKVTLALAKSPSCPNGVTMVTAIADAMTACGK
jgi:hypothetical protein